jgi:peptidoglycan/xylan/chitin deacetylase (PgdA/CDA1 family)
MFPIIKRDKIPVTLFIYPSAISNAAYAMTWPQLAEMAQSGLVDIQSHTYWHPNFKIEARRLNPAAYERFVAMQLTRSKETLIAHLGVTVDMLAWPFGIYDADLERAAERAGYVAGFTLDRRSLRPGDDLLALPRYLVTDLDRGARFGAIFQKVDSNR